MAIYLLWFPLLHVSCDPLTWLLVAFSWRLTAICLDFFRSVSCEADALKWNLPPPVLGVLWPQTAASLSLAWYQVFSGSWTCSFRQFTPALLARASSPGSSWYLRFHRPALSVHLCPFLPLLYTEATAGVCVSLFLMGFFHSCRPLASFLSLPHFVNNWPWRLCSDITFIDLSPSPGWGCLLSALLGSTLFFFHFVFLMSVFMPMVLIK